MGGEPQYRHLAIQDADGMLKGLDREFGALTFDGTQQYFVFDGQHRLRAIKDALLDWRLAAPPWTAVFTVEGKKMIPGKENANLLGDLLHVHLAPKNLPAIKRARKTFKDLRGQQYPISDDELAKRLPPVEVTTVPEIVQHRPELSDQVDAELAALPPEEADDSGDAGS